MDVSNKVAFISQPKKIGDELVGERGGKTENLSKYVIILCIDLISYIIRINFEHLQRSPKCH